MLRSPRPRGSARAAVLTLILLTTVAAPRVVADLFPENDYPDFARSGEFEPTIPAPNEVVGHRIGARPSWHHQIVAYLRALAESSPRAVLQSYGQTHEGRELVVLVVGSEAHLADLEATRRDIARLADPRELDAAQRQRLLAHTPAVAWMGYTIHGDEMSGCDAALALAHRLVAGRDYEARMIRDSLIVLIDPLQNPDGHDRFLTMVYAFNGKVPNPDTQSLHHTTAWPWGRGNHYFFDLNRDWFGLVHPESRGRVGILSAWHPQLVVDGHEMGAFDTYLFSPPRPPFNPHMPTTVFTWWDRLARDQGRAFDAQGWSYYTREWNEEWFPGYGSSWSIYTGAVGMLYEQAGTEGTVIKRPDGTTLDYGEATHHQLVSSMANLTTAARHRGELLRDYVAGREASLEMGARGPIKSFLFPPGRTASRTRRLMETLQLQGIEIQIAKEPVRVGDVHDAWGRRWDKHTFPAGTYRVLLAQPNARLARVLLDFHLQMPDSFLVEERAYLERQRGSRLYEVTAWSLALAYGVPLFWSGKDDGGPFVTIDPLPTAPGALRGASSASAFAFSGDSDAAVTAAAHLSTEGFVVRVARDSFTVADTPFPRGSFLLRSDANPTHTAERLKALADTHGLEIHALGTTLAGEGPDLGGGRFSALVAPRVAIVTGDGVSLSSMGSLFYLFDHELELRASVLPVGEIEDSDLAKYNVILLPATWGGPYAYRRHLGDAGVEKLRTWVKAGGTLIGIRRGAEFLADSAAGFSQVRRRRDALEDHPPPIWGVGLAQAERVGLFQATGVETAGEQEHDGRGEDDRSGDHALRPSASDEAATGYGIPGPGAPVLGPGAVAFAGEAGREGAWSPPPATVPELETEEWERVDARLRRFEPQGCYVRVDLDPEHWLTGGMPARIPAFVLGPTAFLARDPVRTVARFAVPESLHVGGLLWPEAAGRLALTACATRESLGRGQVILLAVDPYFRGYHHAAKRLLLNAALLGPGLGTRQTVPW